MRSAHHKYILFSILLLLASISVTKTTLAILQSTRRLEELNTEVTQLESKKLALESSIDYKKTNRYVEDRARTDLNMVLPGESLYVITGDDVLGASASSVISAAGIGTSSNVKSSNIYHWYKLFF